MKKLLLLFTCFFALLTSNAQDNRIAEKILDKVFVFLSNPEGVRIDFTGSENGYLIMKGEKFYLNNQSIQSWYDGKTQWSYVADTEEVNISHPTPEELQGINPYYILMRYKTDFNYRYIGKQSRNGVEGHEIVLTPKHSGNQEIIRIFISKAHHPLAMKIEQNGQAISEINIANFETNQRLEDKMFQFNKSLYPNAEVIDLR